MHLFCRATATAPTPFVSPFTLTTSPLSLAGLPWPHTSNPIASAALHPALAPPRLIRPLADVWLTSATLHTLDATPPDGSSTLAAAGLPNPQLQRALGWDSQPRASVLCAQLMELGRLHAVRAEVRVVLVVCLSGAQVWVAASAARVRRTLSGMQAEVRVVMRCTFVGGLGAGVNERSTPCGPSVVGIVVIPARVWCWGKERAIVLRISVSVLRCGWVNGYCVCPVCQGVHDSPGRGCCVLLYLIVVLY